MSLRKTYTEKELKLLDDHHLNTGGHSQLSDAFVIGYRKAKDEVSPKQDCADEMMATLESILCTIKLGEAQNGNGQLGRYRNSIEQLLAKARGEG